MTALPDHDKNLAPAPARVWDVVVIGGGPAGLRAAEILVSAGQSVALCDQKASVGRKFLVAGKGGLNLTHSEPLEKFVLRYGDELDRWRELLAAFGPAALRSWAGGLGVETYVGSSGRVFPRGQQAAALLRRWVSKLRAGGVEFRMNHRWEGLMHRNDSPHWKTSFRESRTGNAVKMESRAVILALGGASWPQTGSDGSWAETMVALGVNLAAWQPANCGWEVAWNPAVLAAAEGQPLKNVTVSAGGRAVLGEALITRYGLEGGTLYQLGRELRGMREPALEIDFKPDLSAEKLATRVPDPSVGWVEIARVLKISDAVLALLTLQGNDGALPPTPAALAARIKRFPLLLRGPRPIAEAISSAGGIRWEQLDDDLMLRALPGVFAAGEMIDWEAPTGGYLLQGCFATGTHVGQAALRWLQSAGSSGITSPE